MTLTPDWQKAVETLRQHGLGYPEAAEDFPWGHLALKVRGKMFAVFSTGETRLRLSTKLPHTKEMALMLPFAEPTGYGMGKSGWVTAEFNAGDDIPVTLLQDWMDESYRAIAPKKLVATLPPRG